MKKKAKVKAAAPPKNPTICFWLLEAFPADVKHRIKVLACESGLKTAEVTATMLQSWLQDYAGKELETLKARMVK
jgi:hypothetical protein